MISLDWIPREKNLEKWKLLIFLNEFNPKLKLKKKLRGIKLLMKTIFIINYGKKIDKPGENIKIVKII